MNAAIEQAKRAESGYQFNYSYLNPQPTISNEATDAIHKLTKQMEQITVNYANISKTFEGQNEQSERKRYNRNYNQKNRIDKRNLKCYNCEERGHFARDCLSERVEKSTTNKF